MICTEVIGPQQIEGVFEVLLGIEASKDSPLGFPVAGSPHEEIGDYELSLSTVFLLLHYSCNECDIAVKLYVRPLPKARASLRARRRQEYVVVIANNFLTNQNQSEVGCDGCIQKLSVTAVYGITKSQVSRNDGVLSCLNIHTAIPFRLSVGRK